MDVAKLLHVTDIIIVVVSLRLYFSQPDNDPGTKSIPLVASTDLEQQYPIVAATLTMSLSCHRSIFPHEQLCFSAQESGV